MSSTGALLQKFGARRSDRPAPPPQEGRGVEMSPPVARQAEPRPQGGRRCSAADAKTTPGTTLRDKAEALIVRGKEQGYLTPDEIRSTFPDLEAEPDQIPRVFAAFQDLGIEVTDREKDFGETVEIGEELTSSIQMMD